MQHNLVIVIQIIRTYLLLQCQCN